MSNPSLFFVFPSTAYIHLFYVPVDHNVSAVILLNPPPHPPPATDMSPHLLSVSTQTPPPLSEFNGCPGLCNNNGRCVLDQNVWHCICQSGWRGLGCDVATETLCSDGKDNEGDGLVDCMDPDCCAQISCQGQTYCRGSPDPTTVAGQGQSSSGQPPSKGFYDRVSFLIGPSGSHVIPWDNPFNGRQVA
ncbi:unnamed protein product [Pleuronectes platessa]|uniref:EGF-like domain-containing protein n=1 Tax=Pleuronectes platessa TaxID=8262 RepID=A0A9N7VUL2_PLEPL|nr:unnamed protein product [Pleuronectes platessa]